MKVVRRVPYRNIHKVWLLKFILGFALLVEGIVLILSVGWLHLDLSLDLYSQILRVQFSRRPSR